MQKLRRIAVLGGRHYALLIRCWILICAVRFTLTFRSYRPVLGWIRAAKGNEIALQNPVLFVWAVRHSSRFVPHATCLTRALVVRLLLAQSGQEGVIRIGVASDGPRSFDAHAWVIHDEVVIIGGLEEDISRYNPIVDL